MNKRSIYRMLLRLSIAVFIIGILFRIMHWPFGQAIEIFALFSVGVTSFLFFSSKLKKSFLDELAMVGLPAIAALSILKNVQVPYRLEIAIGLVSAVVLYFGYIVFKWYRINKIR